MCDACLLAGIAHLFSVIFFSELRGRNACVFPENLTKIFGIVKAAQPGDCRYVFICVKKLFCFRDAYAVNIMIKRVTRYFFKGGTQVICIDITMTYNIND